MGRLEGKVAIVTGAARGQGEAEARLFAQEGARVAIVDVLDRGARIAEEIGVGALFIKADVAEEGDWKRVIATVIDAFGRIDILVNNAAVYDPKPLQDTDAALYDFHHRTNQRGVFLGMAAVIQPMKAAGGGSIVNISSIAGLRGVKGSFAYSLGKWAVRGMTKSAALDLAPLNIRVNSIQPGVIDTPMLDYHDEDYREQLRAMTPIGRMAQPREVAQAALFLASDDASYVNGAELTVSAGI